jgi:hypothetical protein
MAGVLPIVRLPCVWLCLAALVFSAPVRAATEKSHRAFARALDEVRWLDQYHDLRPTSLDALYREVIEGDPVVAKHRKLPFWLRGKERAYVESLETVKDDTQRKLLDALLLGPDFRFSARGKPTSARALLKRHSASPDRGMDQELDLSFSQLLMGGKKGTASQGFRHMRFLAGLIGQAPRRAELFYHLGVKAIAAGHEYHGFHFLGWALHYAQDMGTPVHAKMFASLKYLPRLGDTWRMLRKNRFSPIGFARDLVALFTTVNVNHHQLSEALWEELLVAKEPALEPALRGEAPGDRHAGLWRRVKRRLTREPRTVKGLAQRLARRSSRGAGGMVNPLIAITDEKFLRPPGKDPLAVRSIGGERGARRVARQIIDQAKTDQRVARHLGRFVRSAALQSWRLGRASREITRMARDPR